MKRFWRAQRTYEFGKDSQLLSLPKTNSPKMEIKNDKQLVSCPACSEPNFFEPISVLSEGSENLKKLYAGTINKVQCPFCSTDFVVEVPIIYRDDSNHFLVYNKTLKKKEGLPDLLKQMDQLYQMLLKDFELEFKPICRLTITRRDFIEKIAIHQHGYDDRLIEYIKYQLYGHSKQGLDSSTMELYFDFANSNKEQIGFLVFHNSTGKFLYSLNFLCSDYRKLEHYFLDAPEMEQKLNQLFKKHYVHVGNLLG